VSGLGLRARLVQEVRRLVDASDPESFFCERDTAPTGAAAEIEDLPGGLVSARAFATCSSASATRFSGNMNGYSSRQNESSSNHSFLRFAFFIAYAD
jgi:hypothetical protein